MGRKLILLAALVAMSILLAAAGAGAADKAVAVLKDASGKDVGKAELTNTPSGVLIRLDLSGIPAGDHAFHDRRELPCANGSRPVRVPN